MDQPPHHFSFFPFIVAMSFPDVVAYPLQAFSVSATKATSHASALQFTLTYFYPKPHVHDFNTALIAHQTRQNATWENLIQTFCKPRLNRHAGTPLKAYIIRGLISLPHIEDSQAFHAIFVRHLTEGG